MKSNTFLETPPWETVSHLMYAILAKESTLYTCKDDFVEHNYQDSRTTSAILTLCRLCNTVQRIEWSPWKPMRHKTHLHSLKSLSNNLFNIIKCIAACHCHDVNPYGQINGKEKTKREGGTKKFINYYLRT